MASFGLRVPRDIVVTSAREASAAAERLGFPVVLKIASPTYLTRPRPGGSCWAHDFRSGGGGVDHDHGKRARVCSGRPDRRCFRAGADSRPGPELILGSVRDAQFGPVILLGFGGILVEVLRHTVLDLSPVGQSQASDMANSLRGATLLKGVRGSPPADVSALTKLLSGFLCGRFVRPAGARHKSIDLVAAGPGRRCGGRVRLFKRPGGSRRAHDFRSGGGGMDHDHGKRARVCSGRPDRRCFRGGADNRRDRADRSVASVTRSSGQ